MRRFSLAGSAEVLLWTGGALFVLVAAARLLAFQAFQANPQAFRYLVGAPDFAMLSGTRHHAPIPPRLPVCRLQIPRLQMSVAILEGDDDSTLALAPGHLPSSAALGAPGNAVIAGHRDMAFRGLRDVRAGDQIEIIAAKNFRYVVTGIKIVDPDDVSVLAPSSDSVLTIITCYPFYYIGTAPKRFVVQAKRVMST